jgi:GNAT superfamily N-acetyltransferase
MALDVQSGAMVASAMGLHDHSDRHPFGAELGWVAVDPHHRRKGLGTAVCASVTTRLIQAGYQDIHLYTEDLRLGGACAVSQARVPAFHTRARYARSLVTHLRSR